MHVLRTLIFIAVAGYTLLPQPIWAAACKITTTPLNFGTYDIFLPTAKGATAQVTITCNNKEVNPATVQFTLSAGGSGSFTQRRMAGSGGGPPLYYNIYSNAGLSDILGDGSGGSSSPTAVVYKTLGWNITLYGSIPPLQGVQIGSYSDSLVASIIY